MKGLNRHTMASHLSYSRLCAYRKLLYGDTNLRSFVNSGSLLSLPSRASPFPHSPSSSPIRCRHFSIFSSHSSSSAATADDPVFPRQKVQLSRLMTPQESNIRGFVHGGNLIRLMEEAGFVAATRQIAFSGDGGGGGGKLGALVRMDHLDFLAPVEVGDVVEVSGGIDFASPRSCRVSLQLTAASVVQPQKKERGKRLTNKANLWYVPLRLNSDGIGHVTQMPNVDLSDIDPQELRAAENEYWKQRDKREKRAEAERQLDLSLSNVDLLLSQSRTKDAVPGTVE